MGDRTLDDLRRQPPTSTRPQHALALIGCSDTAGRDTARLFKLGGDGRIRIGRGEPGIHREGDQVRILVPDPHISENHATLERAGSSWRVRDEGSRNGTRVGGIDCDERPIEPGTIIETGRTFWRFIECRSASAFSGDHGQSADFGPTRTICPPLIEQLARARLAAGGRNPVLITGETGSGKEVLARQIHAWSGVRGPFHAINCPAVAVFEREMFGHVKGAFTGADEDRAGHMEAANGGTLLLDEVADLDRANQSKLLRAIEEREIYRVGDTRPRHVDVRLLAATNRDIPEMLGTGDLRQDFYGRLTGRRLRLPPLRERAEDLGILIAHFLRESLGETAERWSIDPDTYFRLLTARWPHNVRQLRYLLEHAVALADRAGRIDARHVEWEDDETQPVAGSRRAPERPEDGEIEARLRAALERHRGVIARVARDLRTSRTQVHRWIKKLGIDLSAYRGEHPGRRGATRTTGRS